jgi:phytoene dehydrogenase-like protein
MKRTAVVIGSGPNGLAAAIVLAQAGFDVQVRETAAVPGGAARSGELTLPEFIHDLGSAVHPLALASPFFSRLNLPAQGLRWIWSPAELAHPLDDGTAVLVHRDVRETAAQFGSSRRSWQNIFEPLVRNWQALAESVLTPVRVPRHPLLLARFGIRALQPASWLANSFGNSRAQSLFGGLAAHSTLRLDAPLSSAFGLVLGAAGHAVGWPIPEGGAQSITNALTDVLVSLGGRIFTNARVEHLGELGSPDLTLCDVTPRQFLALSEGLIRTPFRRLLEGYRYGPGVFKVDWALREPIPWKANDCRRALTVHLGGSLAEIAASERAPWEGQAPENPFVLLAQPSLFDPSRAPAGQHTAWAYCHVPNGWTGSALTQIENQVERFAPGFRDCILARATHNPAQMQRWNENLVGGDINGGAFTPMQFAFRPTWREYYTPLRGVYLCSSSTLPGGGVHGMCGYNAARIALTLFGKRV